MRKKKGKDLLKDQMRECRKANTESAMMEAPADLEENQLGGLELKRK